MKLFAGALTAALILSAGAASAQAPAAPAVGAANRPHYGQTITSEQAEAVMAAARAEAKRRGVADTVAIAVVEPTGELIMFYRGTFAQYAAQEWVLGKARTSARFQRPTSVLADLVNKGQLGPLAFPGATVAGAGGVPIMSGGRQIGAIGTTGGFDQEVADAGAAAVK